MSADCHFGAADPLVRPQLLSDDSRFPWLAAIQVPNPHNATFGVMWTVLNRDTDFQTTTSSSGLGTACRTFVRRSKTARELPTKLVEAFERRNGHHRDLRWLYNTFADAVERLDFPSSFRDMARQWACVQRYWAYTLAWIDWNVGLTSRYRLDTRDYAPLTRQSYMGCFTTSTTVVASMARLGLPVWFMRTPNEFTGDEVISRKVSLDDSPTEFMFADAKHRQDHEALFAGKVSSICLAGDIHLSWIMQQSTRYSDRETIAVASNNVSACDSNRVVALTSCASSSSVAGVTRLSPPTKQKFHPCEYANN